MTIKNNIEIPDWADWLARNRQGDLWIYENEPTRKEEIGKWVSSSGKAALIEKEDEASHVVSWEDVKPTSAQYILDLPTYPKAIHEPLKELEPVEEVLEMEEHFESKEYKHEMLLQKLHEMYLNKNADYGDSFHETYSRLGIISAITRILDKTNRIVSLTSKDGAQVEDETIKDTLLDLANYALLTVIELDGEEDD